MTNEISRILKNSAKAEFMDKLDKDMIGTDKAILIMIQNKPEGLYSIIVRTVGIEYDYEVQGIIKEAERYLE